MGKKSRSRRRQLDRRPTDRDGREAQNEHQRVIGGPVAEVLARQRQRFVERFGRGPRPDEPVFFDAEAASPTAWDEATVRAQLARPGMAEELGVEPSFLAALLEVGYAVTEQSRHRFSAEEVRAFEEALARHRRVGDG
jgi:hypothetical protein